MTDEKWEWMKKRQSEFQKRVVQLEIVEPFDVFEVYQKIMAEIDELPIEAGGGGKNLEGISRR